jgi:hypothetical protein
LHRGALWEHRVLIFGSMSDNTAMRINRNTPVGFEVLTAVDIKTFYLLGYNAVQSVGSQPTFRRKNITPMLVTCFMFLSCSAYYSTLKMEVTYCSLTSVGCQRIAWRYITENRILKKCAYSVSFDCSFLGKYCGILLKARTVEPQKQPLLANGSETFFSRPRPRNKQQYNVHC